MTTLFQIPEIPIVEEWDWQTNLIVATDGTEQRVEILSSPKRQFSNGYIFDNIADLRAALAVGLAFGRSFDLPLYQHGTRLTAVAAAGAGALAFTASQTELRDGAPAYVFDKAGGELVTINAVSGAGATLTGVLGRSYGLSASICPVCPVTIGTNATITRFNPDNAGTATLTLAATGFLLPFLNPFNTAVLTTLGDVPVLEKNAVGTSFDNSFDTGIQLINYNGIVEVRSPWQHAQLVMPRSFQCNRVAEPADWAMWRAFADYTKGAQKPFYIPTYRADFDLVTAPVAGGTTLTLAGTDYADNWFPNAPFKAFAIFTAAGVHYTTVTAAVASGGNTDITFATPFPAGETWGEDQVVSLLMKVRIADDKISCQHQSLETIISITIRTVDA